MAKGEVKFCAVAVDSNNNIASMIWDSYRDASNWLFNIYYDMPEEINSHIVSASITATVAEDAPDKEYGT